MIDNFLTQEKEKSDSRDVVMHNDAENSMVVENLDIKKKKDLLSALSL